MRDALDGRLKVDLYVEEALAEPEIHWPHVFTRDEWEDPNRGRWEALHRIVRAMLADGAPAVSWGRRRMAEHVAMLRRILVTEDDANHLWVTHNVVMPFIHLGVVEGLLPAAWTFERVASLGPYGYVEGFSARVAVVDDG